MYDKYNAIVKVKHDTKLKQINEKQKYSRKNFQFS